jgi:15-cis-phytoene synthase
VSEDALVAESAAIIRAGSQSFAAASTLFDARTRAGAHLLYAWCRHCDDVVDGQDLGHGAQALSADERRARVADLERRTREALAFDGGGGGPNRAMEPVFRGLGRVAFVAGIDPRWPMEHLAGFSMDVEPQPYPDLDALLLYCWRVAGVVGVMMAQVMGVPAGATGTLRRAQDLGLAFQLTNIARDVAEDASNGRVYLPADGLAAEGLEPVPAALLDPARREAVARVAARLVAAAEPYYASAAQGLAALPFRSAWAIATALGVYREIGRKVVRAGPAALETRMRVSGGRKAALAAGAFSRALASRLVFRPSPRPQLWTAI